jgi:hypothetical protein
MKKAASSFMVGCFFDHEGVGDMLLRNVDIQRATRCYIPEDGTILLMPARKPEANGSFRKISEY